MNEISVSRLRLLEKLYGLLGSQVKSYHKHRHMGDNSSVTAELARELLESMEYTVAGISPGETVEETLRAGQRRLEEKADRARKLLRLVEDTAPDWQSETRWDALRCLDSFLESYDHLHLAHRVPEELFYPAPLPEPSLRGIDYALYYVNLLWLENQIMAAVEDVEAERLWMPLSREPLGPALNQCEQLVTQLLGKTLLGDSRSLLFANGQREDICIILRETPIEKALSDAAKLLCQRLELGEDAGLYVRQTAESLLPRLEAAVKHGNLMSFFL